MLVPIYKIHYLWELNRYSHTKTMLQKGYVSCGSCKSWHGWSASFCEECRGIGFVRLGRESRIELDDYLLDLLNSPCSVCEGKAFHIPGCPVSEETGKLWRG